MSVAILVVFLIGTFGLLAGTNQEQKNIETVKTALKVLENKQVEKLDSLISGKLATYTQKLYKYWWRSFKKVKVSIDDIFASNDSVAVRWTFHGIDHKQKGGDWEIKYISIVKLQNGKITENASGDNMLHVLKKNYYKITPPPVHAPKGKTRDTMMDLYVINLALESYITDFGYAPKVDSIIALKGKLEKFYIKTLPLKDAWGNPIIYKVDKNNPRNFYIASPGTDGKFKGFNQKGTWPFKDLNKGHDIIFKTDQFTYQPSFKK